MNAVWKAHISNLCSRWFLCTMKFENHWFKHKKKYTLSLIVILKQSWTHFKLLAHFWTKVLIGCSNVRTSVTYKVKTDTSRKQWWTNGKETRRRLNLRQRISNCVPGNPKAPHRRYKGFQLVFKISLKAKMLVLCIITWKSYTKGSYHSNVKTEGQNHELSYDWGLYWCTDLHVLHTRNWPTFSSTTWSTFLLLCLFPSLGEGVMRAGLVSDLLPIWAGLTPLPTVSTSCVLGSQMRNILLR